MGCRIDEGAGDELVVAIRNCDPRNGLSIWVHQISGIDA